MENGLTITNKNMVSLVKEHELGELIKPLQHEIRLFDSYIAGTSNIKDESVFDDVRRGQKLTLQREPDNRFDERSIIVLDGQGRKLGYIPEKDNEVFARLMDAGKYLIARVCYCDMDSAFRRINISIFLVDF